MPDVEMSDLVHEVDELSGSEARRILSEIVRLAADPCYDGMPEDLGGDLLIVLRDAGLLPPDDEAED